MEHLAFCIRMRDQASEADREKLKPRCDGRAAMADAIIALTSNQAMRDKAASSSRRKAGSNRRINRRTCRIEFVFV